MTMYCSGGEFTVKPLSYIVPYFIILDNLIPDDIIRQEESAEIMKKKLNGLTGLSAQVCI